MPGGIVVKTLQREAHGSDLVLGHSLYVTLVCNASRRGFSPGTPLSFPSLSPNHF